MMAPTDPQGRNSHSRNGNDPTRAQYRQEQSPRPTAGYSGARPTSTNSFKRTNPNIFFTRHNPHPQRVYHIKGLNDTLVCKVNDEGICYKEPAKPSKQERYTPKRPISANIPITSPYPANILTGIPQLPCKEDSHSDIDFLYTQAWQEELRDLTARLDFTPDPTKDAKEVLDLLSQMLQTDSLQAIQQWLLTTGQKEKNMMLDMIRMTVANMKFGTSSSSSSSTSKESLLSRESAENTETRIFEAPCPCERRRARSHHNKLGSILEKEPDINRDLKMQERSRRIATPCQHSSQLTSCAGLKHQAKVLNVASSPILGGRLCHSKTDLYKA